MSLATSSAARPTQARTDGRRSRRALLRDLVRLGGGLAGLGLLGSCAPTPAPTGPARMYRVGVLAAGGDAEGTARLAFWERLAELGYVEGQNLAREERAAAPDDLREDPARPDELAAELVRLPVDVLVVVGSEGTRPAVKATASIPIVMMGGVSDPVAAGFVDSLARPGRNVTGIVTSARDLDLKRLELLVEAAPHVTRVAMIGGGALTSTPGQSAARSVAQSLGVDLVVVPMAQSASREDYEVAFERLRADGADAVLFLPGGGRAGFYGPLIAGLAERYRLPGVSPNRSFAESGGLMAYAPRAAETQRRAAEYVDRILRGAQPVDLPVERPNRYDLVVNMRTARALGLTLGSTLIDQVTEVIE